MKLTPSKEFVMDKKIIFSLMLACSILLIANTALFAQASGNEQRLVGNWTGLTFTSSLTFNTNGTISMTGITFDGFVPTHWAAAGDRLMLFIAGDGTRRVIRYFHISTDGRTLIISTIAVEGIGGQGSIGTAWRRD